jgi:tRNA nucleotidyltransferase (CCA-adding enzyme)
MSPPPEILEIAAKLEKAGFESWCVGGAVRDALLGHVQLDWDLATAARPEQVRALFRRTVPVGIEFGTIGVLDASGVMHEVTTFRHDVQTDGRHAVVAFGASLDDDLARRDFTINAIAYSPSRDELRDPFGGRADLERGVLRAVGVPDERMREDRLRALRAIRFASRFSFEIEPATWQAILDSAPHLGRLSPERVKQELEKTMEQVVEPSRAITRWRESGALAALIPALANVPDDVVRALDCLAMPAGGKHSAQRRTNRLAMLFLTLGARDAESSLRALRFSNQQVSWIGGLAARWQTIGANLEAQLLAAGDASLSDAQIRRLAAAIGRTRTAPLLRLASALWGARRAMALPAPSERVVRSLYRRAVRAAFRDPIELGDLAIHGDDLRRAGIAPGPALGKILQRLLDAVVEDPSRNQHDVLLALAASPDRGPNS